MATSVLSEVEAFHRFLGEAIRNGGRDMTIQESVAEFRAWQEELARFNAGLQTSLEQARRGDVIGQFPADLVLQRFGIQRFGGITD